VPPLTSETRLTASVASSNGTLLESCSEIEKYGYRN